MSGWQRGREDGRYHAAWQDAGDPVVRRVIVHDRTHLGAPPFARVHHAAALPSPEDLPADSLSTADAIPRSHPISSGPRDSADPSCRPGRMPYRNTASSRAAPGQPG